MGTKELEKRLLSIERDLAELRFRIMTSPAILNGWIQKIAGTFSSPADKTAFDQAMRYGRQWRKTQDPGSRKRKA